MKINRVRQNVLPLVTAMIWGTAFVAQSVAAEYMGPFTFNTARAVIAFFFLLGLCGLRASRRRRRGESPASAGSRRDLVLGGLCCGAALAVASFFQQKGLETTTPGKAGFITALYIVLVPLAGLVLGRKVPRALWLGKRLGTVPEKDCREMVAAFRELPGKMEEVLSHRDDIQYFASQYFNHDSIFFMGRNLDYALGLEGSLKLKEISYIHSEAYASGELKHGTISLIEDGTLVVALGTYGKLFAKAMSNVVEVKSRGASVLALTTYPHQEEMARTADVVMTIPDIHALLLPILGVVPLQLFAYYVALMRGCDIDKPRNLAKSVTVE